MKPAAPASPGDADSELEIKPGFGAKSIVWTKLRPPSNRAKLIERPFLIEMLQHTMERSLALLHAPAGFGKTTLAAQWYQALREHSVTTAWLSIDASDNDLQRFLVYLVEAIRAAEPEIGSGLIHVIEANPGNAAEWVIRDLINEFQVYDRDIVLFIDDWHLIHNAEIHEVLGLLLARTPPNFHLAIASRSREGIPVTKLRVRNELVELHAADLRFDFRESTSFLAEAKELELDEEDIRKLWRSTEGWVAALQLASISLRRSRDPESILHWVSGTPNDVGEYLAENVLQTLPNDLVGFMMKTSILDRLSADLCRAVTGEAASASFLDVLERQELFLLPLDEERQWFRYHHLFARFLRRRLEREMPEDVPALHLAASKWLSENKQTSEALDHALAAGATEQAVDLVEADAMSLVQSSFMGSLLGLVSRLPRAQTFRRGTLQMAIAWANCLTHHPAEAEEALARVEDIARGSDAQTAALLLGEANVVRACVAVYADRIDGVDAMVADCLAHSADFPPWVVGVAANILTYAHIHTYQFDKVAPLQAWARSFQDSAQGLFSGMYGRCFSGIAATCVGDLATGRKCFQDALVLARNTAGKQSHAARLAGALLGQVLYESNELEEAEQLLEESRILGFEGGVVDFYNATYVSIARLMALKGEHAKALEILGEGAQTARHLKLPRFAMTVAAEEIRLHLLLGDIAAAQRILADVAARCPVCEPGVGIDAQIWDSIQIAKARILIEQDQAQQAAEILERQASHARASGRLHHELRASVLLALACDLAGRETEAENLLLRVVNDCVPKGFVRSFLDEGPRVIALLERVRERARRGAGSSVGVEFSLSGNTLISTFRRTDRSAVAVPVHAADEQRAAARLAPADDLLKNREIEILRYLDQGRANKEIARALGISVDTVKWYLKAIFAKLGVTRRGQAIAEARRLKLMDAP